MRMRSIYEVVFPFMVNISRRLMSLPLSNAWPERGFSKMKLQKNRLRTRLANKTLETLLNIMDGL